MYRTKQQAQKKPSKGEVNLDPSKTVQGEHQDMSDILNFAINGMEIDKRDVKYFRPDEINEINSLFRQSLDLTDLDALRRKNEQLSININEAFKRKEAEQKAKQKEDKDRLESMQNSESKSKSEPKSE